MDVDLKTGDIAVYKKGHDLIVHRIMSFESDYVVFKGDNNNFDDPPVKMDQVLYSVEILL